MTDRRIDEVAVERALAGRPVGRDLTAAEQVELARRLRARGESATALSQRLRCSGEKARKLMREAS